MEKIRIGIDIGKVIIGGTSEHPDTSFFSDNFLATPPIPESFESITMLAQEFDVWLISKCGQKIQERSLEWLEAYNFFDATTVKLEQVIFCLRRNEKAPIAESLGLRVFIDDRIDIISSMKGIVDYPILFSSWADTMETIQTLGF
jgi:5'(3')-deoxyribonucleotidase